MRFAAAERELADAFSPGGCGWIVFVDSVAEKESISAI